MLEALRFSATNLPIFLYRLQNMSVSRDTSSDTDMDTDKDTDKGRDTDTDTATYSYGNG